jgi:D-lactate dehydrogenase (cytochrome)
MTLANELEMVQEVCRECGMVQWQAGVGRDERDRLWNGRHRLGEIIFGVDPNYLITDVAVPISQYPVIASYTNDLMAEMGLRGALFGHAGDGNVHTVVFAPTTDAAGLARVQEFNDQVVQKAISLDGTCTGEHGVGIGKQKYMVHEHGEGAIEVMRLLKRTLDPNDILNPGKVIG